MTKTTIPAEIVRVVRSAIITELGGAAAEIEQASLGYEKEEHPETFSEPFAKFDALRSLLDAVGWSNASPRLIDVEQHREPLAVALTERLATDRPYVADRSIEPATREAVERDIRGIEAFLAAAGLAED
jgi:hypothetical protein